MSTPDAAETIHPLNRFAAIIAQLEADFNAVRAQLVSGKSQDVNTGTVTTDPTLGTSEAPSIATAAPMVYSTRTSASPHPSKAFISTPRPYPADAQTFLGQQNPAVTFKGHGNPQVGSDQVGYIPAGAQTFMGPQGAASTFRPINEPSSTFRPGHSFDQHPAAATFRPQEHVYQNQAAATFRPQGSPYHPAAATFRPQDPSSATFRPQDTSYQNPAAATFRPYDPSYQNPAAATFRPHEFSYQNPAAATFRPQEISYQNPAAATFRPQDSSYQNPAAATFKPQDTYQSPASATFRPQAHRDPSIPPPLKPAQATFSSAVDQTKDKILALKRLNAANAEMSVAIEEKRQAIDVCFLMDLTGTMKTWLVQVREKIIQIINYLQEKFKVGDTTIRVAFVGYSDYDQSDPPESKTVRRDFGKVQDVVTFLDKLLKKKFDGEDAPEDVLSGLYYVMNLSWAARTKILIHIADDPPHNREFHELDDDRYMLGPDPSNRGPADLYQMLAWLCNNDIEYHFFHLDDHTLKMEAVFAREMAKYGAKFIVHQIGDHPDAFLSTIISAINESRTRSWMRG